MKQHDKALADFDHTEQIEPTYAQLHLTKGALLVDLGRRDEARICFDRAATLGDPRGAKRLAVKSQEANEPI